MRARMVWVAFLALALFAANAAAECALPLNQSAAGGLEGQADFTNWYGGGGCTPPQGQALKATHGGRDGCLAPPTRPLPFSGFGTCAGEAAMIWDGYRTKPFNQ